MQIIQMCRKLQRQNNHFVIKMILNQFVKHVRGGFRVMAVGKPSFLIESRTNVIHTDASFQLSVLNLSSLDG